MSDSNLTMEAMERARVLVEAVAHIPVIHFSLSVKDVFLEGEWVDKALQCKPGQKGYIVPAHSREEVMRLGIRFIEYQPDTAQEGAAAPAPAAPLQPHQREEIMDKGGPEKFTGPSSDLPDAGNSTPWV